MLDSTTVLIVTSKSSSAVSVIVAIFTALRVLNLLAHNHGVELAKNTNRAAKAALTMPNVSSAIASVKGKK